jgi:DNA mismatch repair protein MutL
MMMPIRILPEEVASQIAAGEVVERPASVVKELMENALDAGASQVVIRIEKAGRRLVEVADNGAGIPKDEIRLAVQRHATSKLETAEDLFHIKTLGFRGEALASIGSVSRLSIVSRSENDSSGVRLMMEGGQIKTVEETGAPVGTVVRVEDLFFNVPARLKFLKRDLTERQQIDALVTRYAVAYPERRFQLVHDGQVTLQTAGNGDHREVLAALYGIELARQMLEITLEDRDMRINGFISPVSLTRSNRREMTFFVNGRWVQDAMLSSSVLQGYHTLLMVGRYPLTVLFISLPPEEVDVNVHPAKAEVRFRQPDQIFGAVQRAVRRGLLAYSSPPPITAPVWKSHFRQPPFPRAMIDPSWEMAAETKAAQSEASAAPVTAQPALPSGQVPLLRLLGQIGATYLVAEGPDGLYLIDQHAAHERVLFEKLLSQSRGAVPTQILLEPIVFQLPPHHAQLLTEQLPVLARLGFDVELFGTNTFRVRALPMLLMNSDPVAAVRVAVEDFEEDETPLQAEQEARLIARVCKRAAVKAGQTLTSEEQIALLRDLEACQSPRTCPHGRPTMIHLSVDLLERQFGRRGSR